MDVFEECALVDKVADNASRLSESELWRLMTITCCERFSELQIAWLQRICKKYALEDPSHP